MKMCYKCKESKEETEFNKDAQKRDRLSSWCKKCCTERSQYNYYNNRDKNIQYRLKYYLRLTQDIKLRGESRESMGIENKSNICMMEENISH